MIQKTLLFFLICLIPFHLPAIKITPQNTVIKIQSLDEVSLTQPDQTLYLFNLTDTLFDSSSMLGSKAFRKHIVQATKEDKSRNWHDLFTLFIARHYPVKTVEPTTAAFIEGLQTSGFNVFGITGKERNKWYDTPVDGIDQLIIRQLKSIGIDFNNENDSFSYFKQTPEYFEGVFFTDVETKGKYLYKLLKDAPNSPAKIIFVDDKLSEIESVDVALTELGIAHECYWYTATEANTLKFDPLIANIELYYLWMSKGKEILSDEAASVIAEQNPEKTAQDYLQTLQEEIYSKYLTSSKKSNPTIFSQLESYWIHQVESINKDKHEVTLTDGTTWSVGWWWHSKINQWEVGDLISVKCDFEASWYHIELFNASKNQTAWGELNSINIDASELKWIDSFEDHSTTIVLNDGTRLHQNESLTLLNDWREGDFIILLSARVQSSLFLHALWNVTQEEITWSFVVLNNIKEN